MNIKSITAIAAILVTTAARAQVIFQDSFEYTDPDPYYMYNRGGWQYDAASIRYEEGEGPSFPVGPTEGIQPKTGNKMFDFRASTFALQEREIFRQKSSTLKPPVTECSVAFCYRTNVTAPQKLEFRVAAGDRNLTTTIDASKSIFTLSGLQQQRTGSFLLAVGRWYTFRYRIDWQGSRISCFIDSTQVITAPVSYSQTYPYVNLFTLSTVPLTYTGTTYTVIEGAPCAFIDDYKIEGVPEPSPCILFGGLLSGLLIHKRRRWRRN